MTIKDRLISFIEHKHLSINKFNKTIGVSPAYINNMGESIGTNVLQQITRTYPELNIDWLIHGEGEMITGKKMGNVASEVRVFPMFAQGMSVSEFVEAQHINTERIISPVAGADFAIRMEGDSMEPEIQSGAYLLVKRVDSESAIEWGKTFLIETNNGPMVKNLYPCRGDNTAVTCVSINAKYPDMVVKSCNVTGIWRVIMVMTLK